MVFGPARATVYALCKSALLFIQAKREGVTELVGDPLRFS